MRLACLILAHRGAPVLACTAPVFDAAGWDIFVHLDAKANRAAYLEALGPSAKLCRFVENPVRVFWGGYSMIRAQVTLLAAARAAGFYDKFLLISDDTLPLFPPAHLNLILEQDGDFITAVQEHPGTKVHTEYHKFYCYDHPATTMAGPRRDDETEIDAALEAAVLEIAALRRRGKKNIGIACGSQFWALTNDSVDYVLLALANDKHLVESFQYARLPDETLFQSILMNGRYQGGIVRGPVLADFHSQDGGPRVLDAIESLPWDLEAYQLFVRKVAPTAGKLLAAVARLLDGRTIWGGTPEDAYRGGTILDEDGANLPVRTFRLAAPGEAEPASPSWHGAEQYRRQLYRWTAMPETSWDVPPPVVPGGRTRFYLPLIMSKPTLATEARLSFNGQLKRLHLTRQSMIAEFTHEGSGSCHAATLSTPDPMLAHPPLDNRILGVAIGI